jgi:hypothetical protein
MAKRHRAPRRRKTQVLRLNLPRDVWKIITAAASLAMMKPEQMAGAILALGLVKERLPIAPKERS